MVFATAMALLVASAAKAATAIDVGTTTFTISKLGDLTLVVKGGVPEAIVVRGRELTGMGISFSVNGTPYMGDSGLTSNLTLIPNTMPLKFEHDGTICFTVGTDVLTLQYNGTATKTKDVAMLTKTLNSYGDFVVVDGTGVFADLKGVMGTYTLMLVCHIVPGEHPAVGSPVEVTFSASAM
jgi:hypothetical protein